MLTLSVSQPTVIATLDVHPTRTSQLVRRTLAQTVAWTDTLLVPMRVVDVVDVPAVEELMIVTAVV
jgi:hypothetical protein